MRWAARLLASSLLQAAEAMSSMELSSHTCGDLTMAREFNFVSPGFPVSIGHDSLACSLSIDHGCGGRAADPASDQAVCQLRLDFDEFSIQPPLLGNCIFDMFYVGANGKCVCYLQRKSTGVRTTIHERNGNLQLDIRCRGGKEEE